MTGHPAGAGRSKSGANYVVALNHSDWESGFFSQLAVEFQAKSELKRCVDLVDLLADTLAGLVDIVVLDVNFSGLDATTVSRISVGARVVGVCTKLADEQRLQQWGIKDVVLVDEDELGQAARAVAEKMLLHETELRDLRGHPGIPDDITGLVTADLATASLVADSSGFSVARAKTGSSQPARKCVVWSPTAGMGATTVAIGVAEAIAKSGQTAGLIDLDLVVPNAADLLGLTEDSGGLLRSCRQVERGVFAVPDYISGSRMLGDGLRLLAGVPAPHRQPEIKPVALARVLAVAGQVDDVLVVDLGSPWRAASPLSDGTELRFALAAQDEVRTSVVESLVAGDVLIAVVDSSPVSLAKAVLLVSQVQRLSPAAELLIVINRTRKSILGANGLADCAQLFAGIISADRVLNVRHDPDTADQALVSGRTLAEVNSRSSAVADLAAVARVVQSAMAESIPGNSLVVA